MLVAGHGWTVDRNDVRQPDLQRLTWLDLRNQRPQRLRVPVANGDVPRRARPHSAQFRIGPTEFELVAGVVQCGRPDQGDGVFVGVDAVRNARGDGHGSEPVGGELDPNGASLRERSLPEILENKRLASRDNQLVVQMLEVEVHTSKRSLATRESVPLLQLRDWLPVDTEELAHRSARILVHEQRANHDPRNLVRCQPEWIHTRCSPAEGRTTLTAVPTRSAPRRERHSELVQASTLTLCQESSGTRWLIATRITDQPSELVGPGQSSPVVTRCRSPRPLGQAGARRWWQEAVGAAPSPDACSRPRCPSACRRERSVCRRSR